MFPVCALSVRRGPRAAHRRPLIPMRVCCTERRTAGAKQGSSARHHNCAVAKQGAIRNKCAGIFRVSTSATNLPSNIGKPEVSLVEFLPSLRDSIDGVHAIPPLKRWATILRPLRGEPRIFLLRSRRILACCFITVNTSIFEYMSTALKNKMNHLIVKLM